MSPPRLIMAPLKGYTDDLFRDRFSKHFGGFDAAMAPFVPTVHDRQIRPNLIKGLRPERNRRLPTVPQILGNRPDDFVRMARALADMGYAEVNWNLGCPFPMVAKKFKGSGLLPLPDRIDQFLEYTVHRLPCRLSVKLRLGRRYPDEFLEVLAVLNRFPISEVILHPRTGKQMYGGRPDLDRFAACLSESRHPVCYNGDINCHEDFQRHAARFPTVAGWMIGRGILVNPFLPAEIRSGERIDGDRLERFHGFYRDLVDGYRRRLSGPGHLLDRMKGFWTYFSLAFTDGRSVVKKIHRCKRWERCEAIVSDFFSADPEWAEPPPGASIDALLP